MQIVILAAGNGSRMLPFTKTRAKGMVPVANRPLIEHLIISARNTGLTEFVVVTRKGDASIARHFESGEDFGVSISYCQQGDTPGSASALKSARELLEDHFLVLNSDMLLDADDIKTLSQSVCPAIGITQKKDTFEVGIIEEKNGKVARIVEKPSAPMSDIVNTGAYLLNTPIFSAIDATPLSERGELELTQAIQTQIESGATVNTSKLNSWVDVSYPYDLLEANAKIVSQMHFKVEGVVEENVRITGGFCLGSGSIVRSGSYIVGPVIIGENCDIGPNCYIRASSSIGDNCRIGAGVEIKNSIVMNDTKIPHLSYIGDSVIGQCCNIGAGSKTANMRFDKGDVFLGEVNSKRNKMGAIIGDKVQTGVNVSINPGTIIGNNSWIEPACFVQGTIPDDSIVKNKCFHEVEVFKRK